MTYTNVKHYLKNSFIRHFNKKGEWSLSWIWFSISEDSKDKWNDIIFLSWISFLWPNKWDKVNNKISFKIESDSLSKIENNILSYLWYDKDFNEDIIKTTNQDFKISKSWKWLDFYFSKTDKEWEIHDISFDMNLLEMYKFLKVISKIKYILNNRKEINVVKYLNKELESLNLNDEWTFQVKWSDWKIKNIQKTTVQYSAINVNSQKKLSWSFLKFRNEYLFDNENVDSKELLWNKYPITIVTQESWHSFSLPVEEELSILLEKFLKANILGWNSINENYLTEIEDKLLKNERILGVYNNKWLNMLQFKIYSESWTIQYSINPEDKSLTVSRIWIATKNDLDRVRNALIKIQWELKEWSLNPDYEKKIRAKYKNLMEFGKKLSTSKENNRSYFTTFLKIENPLEFIFHLNLINSYLINPLKYEKDLLYKNINNLYLNIENWSIDKNDEKVKTIMNDLSKIYKKEFFETKIELNNNITFSYDSRFVNKLLNQEESRGEKTFKFKFKFNDKNTQMALNLNDIKELKDNESFSKKIDYELDWTKIFKEFSLNKNGEEYEYIYKVWDDEFKWEIKLSKIDLLQNKLQNDIIVKDIYHWNYLNKNFSYLSYKINNFSKTEKKNNFNKL